jgi:ABC-type Mn2+/Zn2+ transport system ATPase subunit
VDQVACVNRRLVAHGRPEEVLSGEVLECMYGPQATLVGHGELPHIVVQRHGFHKG